MHWQDQTTKLAYNGIKVSKEALSTGTTAENKMPTLDHWHQSGGLVARGVLLDYKSWYESRALAAGKSGAEALCDPFDGYRITVSDLEAIAAHQKVEFRPGDVLIVRLGATEVLANPSPEDFVKMAKIQVSGIDGCMETVKWLWNKHFAAVAADNFAFEALPPRSETGELQGLEKLGKPIFFSLLTGVLSLEKERRFI